MAYLRVPERIVMHKPIVLNLYAGPGAGKSTCAAGLFYHLKTQLISCELISEVAKELTYDKRYRTLANQVHVFGSQLEAQYRVADQVDVIITDSPLPLTLFYKPEEYPQSFDEFVMWSFHQFDNMNFFLERHKPYVKIGRTQEEHEARALDAKIKDFLTNEMIEFTAVPGTPAGLDTIVELVTRRLQANATG